MKREQNIRKGRQTIPCWTACKHQEPPPNTCTATFDFQGKGKRHLVNVELEALSRLLPPFSILVLKTLKI